MTDHMKRYFPIEWTDDEQAYAKAIQKEMGKPEDGMAVNVLTIPKGTEIGGSIGCRRCQLEGADHGCSL